ncbi:hypothetical protein NQ317_001242 [Molorchus minor]|uniref:Uncharacterized protein n=1 Tax=Molorchus minor TaxID=1323400 RepID=A0ABQ9J1X5_9CUCU|nr:hypothetical protein NQ317_001242 [Molorchus minor]
MATQEKLHKSLETLKNLSENRPAKCRFDEEKGKITMLLRYHGGYFKSNNKNLKKFSYSLGEQYRSTVEIVR